MSLAACGAKLVAERAERLVLVLGDGVMSHSLERNLGQDPGAGLYAPS